MLKSDEFIKIGWNYYFCIKKEYEQQDKYGNTDIASKRRRIILFNG